MSSSSEQSIATLKYGNPCDMHIPLLKSGEFDDVVSSLKKMPFPSSDSQSTIDEIRQLVKYQNAPEQNDMALMGRYHAYDRDLSSALKVIILKQIPAQHYDNTASLIDSLMADVLSIAIRLKFHYNRPRPFQVAAYLKLPLFQYASLSVLSPSYPCLMTMQSKVVCEVISMKYPDITQNLEELAFDVTASRLFLGHNYMTDGDFANLGAASILKDKTFTSKYDI